MERVVTKGTLALVAGCLLATVCAADQINWGNSVPIYDRFGMAVTNGTPFLIQMYVDGGDLTINPYGTGDDIPIAGATAVFDLTTNGHFFAVLDPVALGISTGSKVYTRVFNAPTSNSATHYVDIGNPAALTAVQMSAPPSAPWDYDPAGTDPSGSDWQSMSGGSPPIIANGSGATGITPTSAMLNGNLTSGGGTNGADITVYWDLVDGGTNAANWTHHESMGWRGTGPFVTNVVGLAPNTNYFYRCFASNSFGIAWSPVSTNFMTPGGGGGMGVIYFISSRDGTNEIYRMNADGSGQQRVTTNALQETVIDVSPDGTKIVCQVGGDWQNAQIYLMNSDGSGATDLTSNGYENWHPMFSPDGTRIAFASDRNSVGFPEIFTMDLGGGSVTQLTSVGSPYLLYYPSWSRDGQKVVFSYGYNVDDQLARCNADGTGFEFVTPANSFGDTDNRPFYRPDGNRIIYFTTQRTGYNQPCEIAEINPDGSGQFFLTTTSGLSDRDCRYSPDGGKVVFCRGDGTNSNIWIMNSDGSSQAALTTNNDFCPVFAQSSVPMTVFNLAPANIITDSAVLAGSLVSAGATNAANVTIYWGLTDCGTNQAAWSNSVFFGALTPSPFATNVTGLTTNTAYYYRCFASNSFGIAWAPSTTNFMTTPGAPEQEYFKVSGMPDYCFTGQYMTVTIEARKGTNPWTNYLGTVH
ncbi:MAG: hypothetical protein PHR35_23085, partial [Kiritimatiellae bacterium]|nr:hypothetical protein [Kiritimatiellia bacterium]